MIIKRKGHPAGDRVAFFVRGCALLGESYSGRYMEVIPHGRIKDK